MVEEHLDLCLEAGINIEGINAEVAAGQWEYQCFSKGAREAGDQMWVSRYILERLGEKYGLAIDWHPKPLGATDWNGSGMHANFSNSTLRTCGSKETYEKICEAFRPVVKEHIEVYGADNDQRLTGDHETQSIDEFSFGVSDRGASIRIPIMTVEKGWKGWLEDRRPASNGDPYKIAARIIKTVNRLRYNIEAPTSMLKSCLKRQDFFYNPLSRGHRKQTYNVKRMSPSKRPSCFLRGRNTSGKIIKEITNIHQMSLDSIFKSPTGIGFTNAVTPMTAIKLKILDPIKFPIEIAFSLLITAIMEADNSGILVPTETTVILTILSLTPSCWLEKLRP